MFAALSTSESINLQTFIEFEMVWCRKIVNFDPRYLEFQGMPSLDFAIFVISSVRYIISESFREIIGVCFIPWYIKDETDINLTDIPMGGPDIWPSSIHLLRLAERGFYVCSVKHVRLYKPAKLHRIGKGATQKNCLLWPQICGVPRYAEPSFCDFCNRQWNIYLFRKL